MKRLTVRRLGVLVLALSVSGTGLVRAEPRVKPGGDGVRSHLDMGYVRRVIEDLTSIGSIEQGFRVFGTREDRATAGYIAREMRSLGLEDVALEPVRGDAWIFMGASVKVSGGGPSKVIPAGSQGGVRGTGADGRAGSLVFAGNGTAKDYKRLGVDAEGKIVFAWWDPDLVWSNHMAYEAQAQGAKALILATPPGGAYYQARGAIGSFDATCDPDRCVPFVSISTRAAQRLATRLRSSDSVKARVVLKARNDPAATGYNTIGQIRGSEHPVKQVILGAHHDAWWTGAVDDTSGVAMMLAVAKAAKESGYQPRYTWVFVTHTGEEYGLSDSYYDWLYGAWWRITRAHPEWQGKAAAFFNFEGHGRPYRLRVNATQEIQGFIKKQLDKANRDLRHEYSIVDIYSWNEAWTFGAAGVPSLTFATGFNDSPIDYDSTIYHTQLDTVDRINFKGLEPVFGAETATILEFDRRPHPPYRFGLRLRSLRKSLDYDLMRRFDHPRAPVRAALDKLTSAWRKAKSSAAGTRPKCFDNRLRAAVRTSLTGFTALSVWDDTIYPHEQVQGDALFLSEGIAALSDGDWKGALGNIINVAQTYYVPLISKAWFQHEMSHHDPDYPKLSWGGQGKLAPYIDLWDEYMSIKAKGRAGESDFAAEIARLSSLRDAEVALFHRRLDRMIAKMKEVAQELRAAAAC